MDEGACKISCVCFMAAVLYLSVCLVYACSLTYQRGLYTKETSCIAAAVLQHLSC